jgi:hypothetical protein
MPPRREKEDPSLTLEITGRCVRRVVLGDATCCTAVRLTVDVVGGAT